MSRPESGVILRIDALDRKILAHLGADGRASLAEVGESVGLSPSAVKRRVDRLVEVGVIRRFTVDLDLDALGPTVEAFVELYCRDRTNPAVIAALVEPHPAVVAAYTVTGDADALIHLRTTGMAELESTLERIRADNNVERTKSVIVLSSLLTRPPAGL